MEGMKGNITDGRFTPGRSSSTRHAQRSPRRNAKNGRSTTPAGHDRALRERLAAATAQLLAAGSVPRLD